MNGPLLGVCITIMYCNVCCFQGIACHRYSRPCQSVLPRCQPITSGRGKEILFKEKTESPEQQKLKKNTNGRRGGITNGGNWFPQ